jgi:hypothetical protein
MHVARRLVAGKTRDHHVVARMMIGQSDVADLVVPAARPIR